MTSQAPIVDGRRSHDIHDIDARTKTWNSFIDMMAGRPATHISFLAIVDALDRIKS